MTGSSENPRILHLISSSGFLGAENVVLELAKESAAMGHWATIGLLENLNKLHLELAEVASAYGLTVEIFSCRGRFDPRTMFKIRDFIRTNRPNLLHSHGYKGNFYGLIASRCKVPWLVTNHNWLRTTRSLKIYARLDSFLIRFADKVVAVSDEIGAELLAAGVPARKLEVIDNGIDLTRFSCRKTNGALKQSFGFAKNSKVIGTVGRLSEEKGHIHLLHAAHATISSFPQARFLIVGEGNQRTKLQQQTIDLGLADKVIFTGTRKDIPDLMSILDLFVLPSLKEGMPMVLLEALAARLPVIASAVGAIPKILTHGQTGFLVHPADPGELTEAIVTLLLNEELARSIANAGHKKVNADFSAQTMAIKYHERYRELLPKPTDENI